MISTRVRLKLDLHNTDDDSRKHSNQDAKDWNHPLGVRNRRDTYIDGVWTLSATPSWCRRERTPKFRSHILEK